VPTDAPSKLLISREEDADVRRITNWDKVEAALHNRGFETVVSTELNYVEQKKLFYGADTIVGIHGA
jgi:capsular polysaccharide biosynthesis protein